ncbi:MAG: hypothetical protein RR280_08715 [Bacteroidaceae bacterium]
MKTINKLFKKVYHHVFGYKYYAIVFFDGNIDFIKSEFYDSKKNAKLEAFNTWKNTRLFKTFKIVAFKTKEELVIRHFQVPFKNIQNNSVK